MIHKGARPEFLPLELIESKRKRKVWIENFPDGSVKYWNNRTLNAGCNRKVTDEEVDGNLIYCNHCKAWFNESQFSEEG